MDFAALGWLGRLPRVLWTRRQCPLCSSIRFEEAELGSLDGPLGLFMLGLSAQLSSNVLIVIRLKGRAGAGKGASVA